MKWPRCNFIFYTEDEEDEGDMRTWRICTRAWGHWIQPMPKGAHMGPVLAKLPWDIGKPRKL